MPGFEVAPSGAELGEGVGAVEPVGVRRVPCRRSVVELRETAGPSRRRVRSRCASTAGRCRRCRRWSVGDVGTHGAPTVSKPAGDVRGRFGSWRPIGRRRPYSLPVVRTPIALGSRLLALGDRAARSRALGGLDRSAGHVDRARPSGSHPWRATSSAIYNSGDLRPDVANAAIAAARQAGATIAFGRSASVGMVGLYRRSAAGAATAARLRLPDGDHRAAPRGRRLARWAATSRSCLAPDALVMGATSAGLRGAQAGERAASSSSGAAACLVPDRRGAPGRPGRRHRAPDVAAGGDRLGIVRAEPGRDLWSSVIAGGDRRRARRQRTRVDIDPDPPELGSAGPRRHDRHGPDQGDAGRVRLSGQLRTDRSARTTPGWRQASPRDVCC